MWAMRGSLSRKGNSLGRQMIKSYIIIIFLFSITFLSAESQFSLVLSSDEDDGFTSRFSSYLAAEAGNWSIINTTKIKYSEFQDNIANYYQENQVKNMLHAFQVKKNWSLDLYLGLGIFPDENHLTEMTGTGGLFHLDNSLSLGGSFNYDNQKYYLDLQTDYISTAYDKFDQKKTASKNIRENDLLWEMGLGCWLSKNILLTMNWDHFNDLNENDNYNYSSYYLQAEYSRRLNYIHYLEQDVRIGYSDLDDELTDYIRTRTRLSSKFAQDWTILNVLVWQGWLNDEYKEIFLGNSWWEANIRKNFKVSENNQLSSAQAGWQYEFDTQIIAFGLGAKYYLNNLKIYADGRYFAGDERWQDYEVFAGSGWEFITSRFNLGYQYKLSQDTGKKQSDQHQIILEYYF